MNLNKKILSIFIILFLSFLNNLRAEDEPVDIWDLEKKLEDNPSMRLSILVKIQMSLKLN